MSGRGWIDEAVNGNRDDEVNQVQDGRRMVRFVFVAAVWGDASTTLPQQMGSSTHVESKKP